MDIRKITTQVEEFRDKEHAMEVHGELLKRYDSYLVRDLQYSRHKRPKRILYLQKEKLFIIVTNVSIAGRLMNLARKENKNHMSNR